ncbi:MAG: SPOR domain-containing protein [Melioribacteraceae bacterium]|nr:SPOR domain-containing protein [Melioribacteraceae bacterium]
MKRILLLFTSILLLNSAYLIAQDVDIVPYLKMVESGRIAEVNEKLPELKATYPDDPSILFLDAVLTESGEEALLKYEKVVKEFPTNRFADAARYRMFSYYFALGLYKQAENNLRELKQTHPNSPYIKFAEKNLDFNEPSTATNQTPAAPKSETKKEKVESTAGIYTVQAGAFLNLDNARKLKSRLNEAGFEAEIKPKSVGASILNAVVVGNYANADDAKITLDKIFDTFKIKGRIVNLD